MTIIPSHTDRPRALPLRRLLIGGACALAVVMYVTLRRLTASQLNETPVAIIALGSSATIEKRGKLPSLDAALRDALEDVTVGILEGPDEMLISTAAPTMHAILNADWDAMVASLRSNTIEYDATLAEHLREKWRSLPPRDRPADLASLSHGELLELRMKGTRPLATVDLGRIGVRVFDRLDEQQNLAAQAAFADRYGFLFRQDGSVVTAFSPVTVRPAGLPPYEQIGDFRLAAIDVPGRTAEGAFVVLTFQYYYIEPFGWVLLSVDAVTHRTSSEQAVYMPRT